MEHVIVCVIVGVLLQWNNVESHQTMNELVQEYAELHPNTGVTEQCQALHAEGRDNSINPLNAVIDSRLKWPGNVAYYYIDERYYSSSEISQIRSAVSELENLLALNGYWCFRILPRTNQYDYIYISKGSGCSSYVGRIGGAQQMSLANGCIYKGIIQHEFLHALGFNHEQCRTDRDSYVQINYSNIQKNAQFNFDKMGSNVISPLGTSYDYSSVMHYGAYDFAINPSIPTIIPYDKNAKIGQRSGPSRLDIERVQIQYGCIRAADSVYYKDLDI